MSEIVGLIREVVIMGDAKEILVEINKDFADFLVENMEVSINGHTTSIRDINENRFKTDLEELDNLIYGSEVSISLKK